MASRQRQPRHSVRMQVSAGFGGYYRPSVLRAHPRRVYRTAAAQIAATIRVDDVGPAVFEVAPYNHVSYTATVVLPERQREGRGALYSRRRSGTSVIVSLLVQGHVAAQQAVNVNQVSSATESIGVLSRAPSAYVQLKSFGGSLGGIQFRVMPLTADALEPQAFALTSLDAIVLENFDTTSLIK